VAYESILKFQDPQAYL